jgi:long-chain-acyl-CoA dehydrogenase
MQIGTRDIFDSDHDMFREMTRNLFDKEVKPFHAEWEKAGEVPRELWTKAGELGLLATMTPEAYGGMVRFYISPHHFLTEIVCLRAHPSTRALSPCFQHLTSVLRRRVLSSPHVCASQGCDAKYPAIVWEEQSYSGCTGPGFAMHSDIVAPYVLSRVVLLGTPVVRFSSSSVASLS